MQTYFWVCYSSYLGLGLGLWVCVVWSNTLIIYILTPTHCSHQKAASLAAVVNLQFLALGTSPSSFSGELDPDVYMKNPEQMESEELVGKTWRCPFCPSLGLFAKINDMYQGRALVQAHWNSASSPNSDCVSDCFCEMISVRKREIMCEHLAAAAYWWGKSQGRAWG